MAAARFELEGRFVSERYRSGDFMIGAVVLANGSKSLVEQLALGSDCITIKGDAPREELEFKQTYRFFGTWNDYQGEKQFKFHSFVPAVAHDREGIIAYLESVGRGCGMGYGTARMAWERWGQDAVRVIRENPRELLAISRRITDAQLQAIGEKLVAQAKTEHAQIEVTNLLAGRGFPKSVFRKAIKAWGVEAPIRIKEEPYLLMRFRGVGFKRCDALYIELGHDCASILRQALCAWYAIASDSEGHVWYPIEFARQAVRKAIGRAADPDAAIEHACAIAKLSPDRHGALAILRTNASGQITPNDSTLWVAEGRKAATEEKLAKLVVGVLNESKANTVTRYQEKTIVEQEVLDHARCSRCGRQLTAPEVHIWAGKPFGPTCITAISDGTDVEVVSLAEWLERNPKVTQYIQTLPKGVLKLPQVSLWPDVDKVAQLTAHQRENLAKATVGRIGILGGSPGTGKTHSVAQFVKAIIASGLVTEDEIAIGAPTGKATVRLNEALLAADVPVRARTWHSHLGVGEPDDETGNWSFLHNAKNPWRYKVLIADEESMRDMGLMCAMFEARPRGCHMLLIGDINQLAPVGDGAPLRDFINAGLPYGQLTEIMRNSGGIVEACAAIRDGKNWEPDTNNIIIPASTPAAQLQATIDKLDSLRGEWDPVWDAQVIVAVNKRSPLSRKQVNEFLQGELNSNQVIEGSPFRLDDKVVCTGNTWYDPVPGFDCSHLDKSMCREKDYGGHELYVANGEIGRVLMVEDKKFFIGLSNPTREIVVPRGKYTADEDEGSSTAGTDDDADDKPTTGCKFELAYGISCHKMQGSEIPNAIILIDEYAGARSICSREWFITAISRAKSLCVSIGKKSTMDSLCKRTALTKRRTFLAERIMLLQAEKVIQEVL